MELRISLTLTKRELIEDVRPYVDVRYHRGDNKLRFRSLESNVPNSMVQMRTDNSNVTTPEIEDPDPEPTDYSKRYKENPVDEFEAPRAKKRDVAAEDTVKVYRTEGTPLNFSLSSSLTDLRDASSLDFLKPLLTIDERKLTNYQSMPMVVPLKKPKPVPPPKPPNLMAKVRKFNAKVVSSAITKYDAKSVTFDDAADAVEETPLMFSRCSSLGSVESCEAKSMPDDGSVISEFSRRASGVVSPSDLPDSPGHTVPSTPKGDSNTKMISYVDSRPSNNKILNNVAHESCFRDTAINYAVEETPTQISLATSLSSLCVNDIDSMSNVNDNSHTEEKCNKMSQSLSCDDHNRIIKPSNSLPHKDNDVHSNESLSDDDDGNLLAACISSGMPSMNSKDQLSVSSPVSIESKSRILPIRSAPDGRCSYLEEDSVRVFQTEGTPATMSNATSISELSLIASSVKHHISLSESKEQSDDDDDTADEDDEMLMQCIRSGMPSGATIDIDKSKLRSISRKNGIIAMTVTPATSPNESPNNLMDRPIDDDNIVTILNEPKLFDLSGNESETLSADISHNSLSSLSNISDNGNYLDDDKLLEECITSGMPNNNNNDKLGSSDLLNHVTPPKSSDKSNNNHQRRKCLVTSL